MSFSIILNFSSHQRTGINDNLIIKYEIASNEIIRGEKKVNYSNDYYDYFYAVKYGLEEPLTTHADRFNTNAGFSIGSYTKGSMFLSQLNYIIGEENTQETIKKYYSNFKFKHPTPNNFKRTAEIVSGLNLEWYLNEWIETTHTIDYAISKVEKSNITLARVGQMPMPIDITVTYTDGTSENFNIPLSMMQGNKPTNSKVLKDWAWAYPHILFLFQRK